MRKYLATLIALTACLMQVFVPSVGAESSTQPGCGDQASPQTIGMDVTQTALLAFPNAPNPAYEPPTPRPNVSPSAPPMAYLAPGQKLVAKNGSEVLVAAGSRGLWFIPDTPPPQSSTTAQSSATPPPPATVPPQVSVQDIDNMRPVSLGASPLPLPSVSPGSAITREPSITAYYPVTAQQPGISNIMLGNGKMTCRYRIYVSPGRSAAKLLLTTGLGASTIPINTIASTSTPAGQYVYYTEKSAGQTFVPVLANFRFTNLAAPLQFYLTGGFAATSSPNKSLFGISVGSDSYLFTIGWHSTSVDVLQPGVVPNAVNALTAPSAPITFMQRTTRPFAAIAFPICSVSQIFGSIVGTQACASPTPAPAPSTAPINTSSK